MGKKKAKEVKKKKKGTKPKRSTRISWLDDESGAPVIEKYARQLESFIQTMADGVVDESELKDQEKRLTKLMKKLEPKLDDELHEQVTRLLCELTAYDLMQMLYTMQELRRPRVFQG